MALVRILPLYRPGRQLMGAMRWIQLVSVFAMLVFVSVEVTLHRHGLMRTSGNTVRPAPLMIPMPVSASLSLRGQAVSSDQLSAINPDDMMPLQISRPLTTTTTPSPPPSTAVNEQEQRRALSLDLATCRNTTTALIDDLAECLCPSSGQYCPPSSDASSPNKLPVKLVHPLIEVCMRIKLTLPRGIVYVQYLDKSYLELTKSWICNVLPFRTVLPRVVFVATDMEAYNNLTAFSRETVESQPGNEPLNIVLFEYVPSHDTGQGLTYGTLPYYDLMLFRTEINFQLLIYGIDIFIIESDSVWTLDPSNEMFNYHGDVVTINDMQFGLGITHGFSLWRSSPRILEFMRALLTAQQNIVDVAKSKGTFQVGDTGNEQFHIMRLMRTSFSDLRVAYLPASYFCNGRRFDDKIKPEDTAPYIRHNNYVMGNQVKIQRAKTMGFWYLNDSGERCMWGKTS